MKSLRLMIPVTVVTAFFAIAPAASASFGIKSLTMRSQTTFVDWGAHDASNAANITPALTASTADDNFATIPSDSRPGAHAWLNGEVAFTGSQNADDLTLRLPPGFVGNPRLMPRCTMAQFNSISVANPNICSGSRIGFLYADATSGGNGPGSGVGDKSAPGLLYNLEPVGTEVARLGAIIHMDQSDIGSLGYEKLRIPNLISVRTSGDFAIESTQHNLPLSAIQVAANAPQHFSTAKIKFSIAPFAPFDTTTLAAAAGAKPFMTNPTQCSQAARPEASATSYDFTGPPESRVPLPAVSDTLQGNSLTFGPCSFFGSPLVPFNPQAQFATGNDSAGTPSGDTTVGITFPDYNDSAATYESHVRKVETLLPEGMTLNPAAARSLAACSDEQFGYGSDSSVACPEDSDIGDLQVTSAPIDTNPATPATDPLRGELFFGKPQSNDKWRLFMLLEGAGLRIKLKGSTVLDEQTGRVRATFDNLPQVPFQGLQLTLRGGNESILRNPESCGSHDGTVTMTPWSGGPDAVRTVTVTTNSNCPPADPPFAPALSVSPSTTQAGASTDLDFDITRSQQSRLIHNLNMSLPPGLIGSLKDVPLCAAAQADAGSCPIESKVGRLRTTVGADASSEIGFDGSIYIAEPRHDGDVASLSIKTPAAVGPIDLGNVVVNNQIRLRPSDTGIDVVSGPIPSILAGVPLPIRKIAIDLTRNRFMLNPTSCAPRSIEADFAADGAPMVHGSVPYQATGCENLPFKPHIRMIVGGKGETAARKKPPLRAIVTQTEGESSIASSVVTIPDVMRPDTVQLNKPGVLCNASQLAAAACPPQSLVGTATVETPLLPQPLSGPVHIIQENGRILPTLAVQLRGMASIDLQGRNSLAGIKTVNAFEAVPDAPISRFELSLTGGPDGILKNFYDLCSRPAKVGAVFTGHSGATHGENPRLDVEGCPDIGSLSLDSKTIKVSKKGVGTLKMFCSSREDACAGKAALSATKPGRGKRRSVRAASLGFSVPAGASKSLKVKVSKAVRKLLKKKRRSVKGNARLTVGGRTTTVKLTFKR